MTDGPIVPSFAARVIGYDDLIFTARRGDARCHGTAAPGAQRIHGVATTECQPVGAGIAPAVVNSLAAG